MTVTFFFLDRTFINRPKELRWAATIVGKLPTWFCCSASLHFFQTTTPLDSLLFVDTSTTDLCWPTKTTIPLISPIYPPHILHKSQSLSPQTLISLTTWNSQFHSITTLSCITKFTITFAKNHITNTCIHISLQITVFLPLLPICQAFLRLKTKC